jgi:DNA recombination protein RmuC
VTTAVLVLLVFAILISTVLLVILVRGGWGRESPLFQQQLIELRGRLDAMAAVQERVPRALAEGSAEQIRSMAAVREELVRLSEATTRLEAVGRSVSEVQRLLEVPRLRGTLGELWLEELLRQVFPKGFYDLQYGFKSGDRVDAVIRLGGKLVPVDSKFPLEACQRMMDAEGDAREVERRAFRKSLKLRIDEIADKYIKPEEGTYEFALMYIPAESVYYEAVVRRDEPSDGSSVVAHALRRKVIPVSPNTFYAYLSAVLHGLKGLEVEQRAREILDSLTGLQQQFGQFERAYELVGKHLTNALKQYDETERQLGAIQRRFDAIPGSSHEA